ncbi:ABC transporter ATP-binding protein [Fodinicurvata sp. EGI_FJ10296]|uniref:ABC transporter ATP-binding protein n=1 Tax=Fodinicurvata sp. EGI_FJ10296 TaxID=3231908 RepID=UPI003451EF5B
MTLTARARQSLSLWRKLYDLLRFSSRGLSLVVAVLLVAEAVFGIALLYFVKLLVDVVSEQLGEGGSIANPAQIFLYLGLIGLMMVLAVAFQRLGDYAGQRQGMEVADYVDRLIHERAIQVDLSFYENPQYYDSLQRARAAGSQRPAMVITTLSQLLRSVLFLVAILVLMAALDWRLVPIIVVSMAAALVVRMHFTRLLHLWRHRRAQMERRAEYLDWLLTSAEHAKELRIGRLGGELRDRYSRLRRQIRSEQLSIEKRKMVAEVGAAAAAALVFFGATTWLVLRVIEGTTGLGDLVLFLLLFRRAEASGREFVTALSGTYDHQLYLSHLFSFFEVSPEITTPAQPALLPHPIRQGIRFHGVTFTYPATETPALSSVDFELQAGKITAIVGENGSGKTSLIKLLCRLYDPTEGSITLDGVDIREFDPVEYRRIFSVIFQDYARYAETVGENIRFGDITVEGGDPRIAHAADLGGGSDFIRRLPKGLETPLTKLFDDGHELSLGQWQRVALSRAFFPHSEFIIMDEPTSAVDPRAEAELFDNFRARLEGRGALIISHRLSTIRMADTIYMLSDGKVLEHGTHEALVARQGRYAQLFERQARPFRSANP